jgi:RNA polymerase sigma factor (sigma-70 family)
MNQRIHAIATKGTVESQVICDLYNTYAKKLLNYTRKNYGIDEEDAMSLVYKTIYRIAELDEAYEFENESKKQGFIFKTHINHLRNYFRDNKTFEARNYEVELTDIPEQSITSKSDPKMNLLQKLLDEMEEWQRILLLLRGQSMSYSEIAIYVKKPEKQLKVYYSRLKKKLLEDMNAELNRITDEKK